MQNQLNSAAMTSADTPKTEPAILTRKIGSTTYKIVVHFSEGSSETIDDKVLRLIKREVSDIA